MKFLPLLLCAACLSACGPKYIYATQIEDTPANRALLGILQEYKQAMEKRDANGVLKLCSQKYFEDNGNADPNDDYGYGDLRDRVLPDTFRRLTEVQLDLEVREIRVDKDRANADVRFSYRAKMALPAGDKWNVDTQLNPLAAGAGRQGMEDYQRAVAADCREARYGTPRKARPEREARDVVHLVLRVVVERTCPKATLRFCGQREVVGDMVFSTTPPTSIGKLEGHAGILDRHVRSGNPHPHRTSARAVSA